MKKCIILIITFIISSILLFTACSKTNNEVNNNENINQIPNENMSIDISDYFPFKENIEYKYKGIGNEYAEKVVYVDYIDNNKIQLRTINPGTTSISVIEKTNDEISIINSMGEIYHRENYINEESNRDREILIKAPIKEGTAWLLPNGDKRSITSIDKEIETEIGTFNALEITTEGKEYTSTDYYVKNIGHVKSIYQDNQNADIKIITEIEQINKDKPFTQNAEFYYVKSEPNKFILESKGYNIDLRTNENIIPVFEKYLKTAEKEELAPIFNKNTRINNMGKNLDSNTAFVDLSKEFIEEMNAGAEVEALKLQAIVNTVGRYYNSEEVVLTVEDEPYSSGHIQLEKGETIKVNIH